MSITIKKLKELSTERSFERGVNYYEGGYVNNPIKFGNTIKAEVSGRSYPYYDVEINIDNPDQNFCSCPYNYGGICKHKVALGLQWYYEKDSFKEVDELNSYKGLEYNNFSLFDDLFSYELFYILFDIVNKHKRAILNIFEYREHFDKMNTELYNLKAKVLKDLIIEDIEKLNKQGCLIVKERNSYFNYIDELIDILDYHEITKKVRKEIIDDIIERLLNRQSPEKELMHDIIKFAIQSKDELNYVIDKINYIGQEKFIKELNEKDF